MPSSNPPPGPSPLINNKLPGDLAGAVALIQQSAQAAAEIQVAVLEVKGQRGEPIPITVAFLPDGQGGFAIADLGTAALQGAKAEREIGLLTAPGPDRREGTAQHQALCSFIDHLNRFRSDNSALWADEGRRALVGVFDYHEAGATGAARWGRHRAVYPCPLSEAWGAWGGLQGLTLNQEQFAELLDRRDRELTSGMFGAGAQAGRPAPTPADLVTLAANLETYSAANCKKERDPTTQRTKLTFTEEAGVSVAPPAAFLINVPVFIDSAPQQLEVRLRVSVEATKAKFQLRIHAAGDVLRGAFENLAQHAASETKLPLFIGTPEA